jgi:ribosomal protein L1
MIHSKKEIIELVKKVKETKENQFEKIIEFVVKLPLPKGRGF